MFAKVDVVPSAAVALIIKTLKEPLRNRKNVKNIKPGYSLKVSKNRNEFMKTSFLSKSNARLSVLIY